MPSALARAARAMDLSKAYTQLRRDKFDFILQVCNLLPTLTAR